MNIAGAVTNGRYQDSIYKGGNIPFIPRDVDFYYVLLLLAVFGGVGTHFLENLLKRSASGHGIRLVLAVVFLDGSHYLGGISHHHLNVQAGCKGDLIDRGEVKGIQKSHLQCRVKMGHRNTLVLLGQAGRQELDQFRGDHGIVEIHRLRPEMVTQSLNDPVGVQITQVHQGLKRGHPLGFHLTGGLLNLELVQKVQIRDQRQKRYGQIVRHQTSSSSSSAAIPACTLRSFSMMVAGSCDFVMTSSSEIKPA